MIGRSAFVRGVLGCLATLGPAFGQSRKPPEEEEVQFGDLDDGAPPTKAYRDAVRVKGIGLKAGEISSTSALIWARVPPTNETYFQRKRQFVEWLRSLFVEEDLQARMRFGRQPGAGDGEWTAWADVSVEEDFAKIWRLMDLNPATLYYYSVEAADEERQPIYEARTGQFRTAPLPEQPAAVRFTVVGCQRYDRLDDSNGYAIYRSMTELDPDFTVLTGDTVYLDRGPLKARNYELALDRWRRTYELPYLFDFHARFPAYWQKDDHDILRDDASPDSPPYGQLTFEEGLKAFALHTPVGEPPYRRFRWGSLVEIWLLESREFRDSNRKPDGPNKSLLGEAQKDWLRKSLRASNAAWRILISPTPVVGPDRARFKRDNLSNKAWDHEAKELRSYFAELGDNFFIICGDRHWQYCSVHPDTGVQEFCCGPATDAHAGGSPGFEKKYHRFHRVSGGFLSVEAGVAETEYLAVRLHSVDGQVVFEDRRTRTGGRAD